MKPDRNRKGYLDGHLEEWTHAIPSRVEMRGRFERINNDSGRRRKPCGKIASTRVFWNAKGVL